MRRWFGSAYPDRLSTGKPELAGGQTTTVLLAENAVPTLRILYRLERRWPKQMNDDHRGGNLDEGADAINCE
jgi:hypothetical protein